MNDLGNMLRKCRANFAKGAKIKKIKIKKIPCVFAVPWYSLTMKKKAPQKGQIWAIGNIIFRVEMVTENSVAGTTKNGNWISSLKKSVNTISEEEVKNFLK
jgi:hypothetical protein